MSIPSGALIAQYDFSNVSSYPGSGTTLSDLSGSGFTLTNSTLSGTFAGSGQSKYYSFAGGSDQFWRNDTTSAFGATNRLYTGSMFLWVRSADWTTEQNSYKCIAGWGEDIGTGGGQIAIWKQLVNAYYAAGAWGAMGSGWGAVQYPLGLTNNTWQHVGYTIDGTTATIYIDGVAVAAVDQDFVQGTGPTGTDGWISSANSPYLAPIALGGLYNSYYGSSGYDIAIAEFYNIGVSGVDALALYNSQSSRFYPPAPPANTIIDFDFSNPACYTSGTTINDLSAFGNDFTLSGTGYTLDPSLGGGSLFLSFTTGCSRSLLNSFGYGTDAFSVNMWIYQTDAGTSGYNMFFQLADTGGAGPAGNTLYLVNQTGAQNISGQFNGPVVNTSYDLTFNNWKMLTLTKPASDDGTGVKIYVDGVDVTTTVTSPTLLDIDGTTPTTINGGAATFGFWKNEFYLGELQFHDTALTAGEVLAKYNATSARYNPAPPPNAGNVGGRTFGQGFAG